MRSALRRALAALACLWAACCATDASGLRVTAGDWGNSDALLVVSEMGATAFFHCGATGTLTAPLVLDASAHFTVGGTYELPGAQGSSRSATYSGVVNFGILVLTVRLSDQTLGPFELHEGESPMPIACP